MTTTSTLPVTTTTTTEIQGFCWSIYAPNDQLNVGGYDLYVDYYTPSGDNVNTIWYACDSCEDPTGLRTYACAINQPGFTRNGMGIYVPGSEIYTSGQYCTTSSNCNC